MLLVCVLPACLNDSYDSDFVAEETPWKQANDRAKKLTTLVEDWAKADKISSAEVLIVEGETPSVKMLKPADAAKRMRDDTLKMLLAKEPPADTKMYASIADTWIFVGPDFELHYTLSRSEVGASHIQIQVAGTKKGVRYEEDLRIYER